MLSDVCVEVFFILMGPMLGLYEMIMLNGKFFTGTVTHKALLGIKKKPSKMEDDEWNNIDFRIKTTIILCLSDEVLYNVMNEETTADLWCRLKSFYMIKSVEQALHEEAVIQPSDEGWYAYFTISQCF